MAYIKPTEIIVNGRGLTSSASSATGISPVTLNVNTATTATLGIIQVGSGLSITPDGVLSATGGGTGNGYTGSAGSTGTQGTVGFTGSAGSLGYTGSAGAGYTGSASTATGYTGSRGIDGVTTTTTIAATIIGTTSTTAGIPGFSTKIYNGSLNDGYTLTNGDLYVWKGGDVAGSTATIVEYLIVAGGGAGGYGGGGGGGVLTTSGYVVAAGSPVSLSVGDGGVGATNPGNSTFASFTAIGGGRGGSAGGGPGAAGGSGGGASYDYGNAAAGGGAGTAGQGNRGGHGSSGGGDASAGGGGGAGGIGTGGYANGTNLASGSTGAGGGAGGIGLLSSISGTPTYYGGGGGGGGNINGGNIGNAAPGGLGGGGNGATTAGMPNQAGTDGTANTGGGGGGGDPEVGSANFKRGGSGIVIIRYADTYPAASATTGSPTVLTTSGYRIYSWTTVGSGSITFANSSPVTGQGWVLAGNIKGIPGEAAAIGYTGSAGSAGSTGPKITSVTVTDSSYNNLDDTAVALTGGYIKIAGSGFESGCQVLLGTTLATSVSYISSTEVRAQLPASSTGTYIIYLVNSDGGTAIRVNAVTFSSTPSWTTGASLEGAADIAISIQLAATDATSYALAAGSSLPSGISLSSGGLLSGTITGLSVDTTYNFTIVATDAELQDSTRAFTFAITVGEPYFKYVSLLLPGNGTNNSQNNTFLDRSTNNFTITRNGNVSQGTFSPYGSNWSLYTNGTNSYAYLPYNAARSIGTGDFSIECWVYIARQPANYTRVWSHQSNWGLSGSIGVELAFGTVDTLIQTLVDGNSTTYTSATYDTSGTGGSGHVRQWIHVVSSRQNGYLRLIVNGILREANTNSTNINGTSTTSFGTNSQLGGDLTELYISNFRMCIGSVPTEYSTTSTTAGTTIFTPPTSPVTTTSQGATGVQLLVFQDNRIIDRSSNAFTVTTVGNPSIQRFSPFGAGTAYTTGTISGSAYFDGSGDYLLNTGTTAGQLGSGDFTFECWYYPTNTTFGTGGANTAAGIFFDSRASAGDASGLSFYTMTNGTISIYTNSGVIFTTSNAAKAFAWNHIAFVRSGSTITSYINGVSGGTVTSSVNFSSGRLQISGPVDYSTGYIELVGYVCDHRVVKGTAVYTTAFTPPTSPLTAIANTSLLLNYTNAGIIDNAMQNNLETVGDVKLSTTQNKFGTSSMYFDGTGDYCFIRNTQAFLFGSGNFTIELWAYIGDTSTRKYILGPGTDTASHYDGFGVEIWGQQLCVWASSNGTGWDMIECDTTGNRGATLLSANTWYHIAVTRSGNTFRTFVNGVVEKTYTSSAAVFSDATVPYNIGRTAYQSGTFYYNGYMDDLRVTKGYARYTTTFTPPTSAHPLK